MDELVREEWACPVCGERRIDCLIVRDEDKEVTEEVSDIECSMCGTKYRINLTPEDTDDEADV